MSESEYLISPGSGEWTSYEQLIGVLAAWNDLPFGAPVVTISKRKAGARRCVWIPGDATPSCDFDPECPAHGEKGDGE